MTVEDDYVAGTNPKNTLHRFFKMTVEMK